MTSNFWTPDNIPGRCDPLTDDFLQTKCRQTAHNLEEIHEHRTFTHICYPCRTLSATAMNI